MENKKFVGVVVVAAIIGAYFIGGTGERVTVIERQAPAENVGGQRGGLQEFSEGVTIDNVTIRHAEAKLPVGQDYVVVWYNNLGKDVIANYGEAIVTSAETASSTSKISLFATTSSTVNDSVDFGTLAEGKRALIQAVNISTSTTATTTSSTYAMAAGKGNGSVLVAAGSYLMGYLQKDTAASTGCGALTGLCETATSSNRGFNPVFRVRLHHTK